MRGVRASDIQAIHDIVLDAKRKFLANRTVRMLSGFFRDCEAGVAPCKLESVRRN